MPDTVFILEIIKQSVKVGIDRLFELIDNAVKSPSKTVALTTKSNIKSSTTTLKPQKHDCGIAPDFKPCFTLKEANAILLDCCIEKSLPEGCYDLCRYDVTQEQVCCFFNYGIFFNKASIIFTFAPKLAF